MHPGHAALLVDGVDHGAQTLADVLAVHPDINRRAEPGDRRVVDEEHHRPAEGREAPDLPARPQGQQPERGVAQLRVVKDGFAVPIAETGAERHGTDNLPFQREGRRGPLQRLPDQLEEAAGRLGRHREP